MGYACEIFPLLSFSVALVDLDLPMNFLLEFILPVPSLTGLVDFSVIDSIEVPGCDGITPPAGGFYFERQINGITVSALGSAPLAPGVSGFSDTGQFNCALLIGGCTEPRSRLSLTGPGNGGTEFAATSFDVNDTAPIPLPAGLPLLITGLAAMIALRRGKTA